MIDYLFGGLFFLVPLVFYPKSSEVFEFNKLIVTYIITILIVDLWIARMVISRKIIFRRTILDIPIIAFLISQILSTIFSIDVHTSIFGYYSRWNGGLLSTLAYCLLYWAFVSNINKKTLLKILYMGILSATLVSIYANFEHFGHSVSCIFVTGNFDVGCWYQDVATRVFATLGQPNWLAAYLTSLIPLAWNFALGTKKKQHLIVWVGVSILFFIALIFTKSRSGLLAFVVESVIFWGFILFKDFNKNFPIFLVLILSFAGLFFVFNISTITGARLQTTEHSEVEQGGTESGDIRKIVWKGAIDIWRANPILGTGVETFAYSYYQYRPKGHNLTSEWNFLYNKAHNEYLNFAANSGSLGLVSYLILILFSILQILKIKDFGLKVALLAGYVSILITNFFGFSVVVVSLLFFLIPAFSVAAENKEIQVKMEELTSKQKLAIFTVSIISLLLLFCVTRYWVADYDYSLGKMAYSGKEYKSSIENYLNAININPIEASYHSDLATTYSDVGLLFNENKDATAAAKLSKAAIYETVQALTRSPRNMNIRYTTSNILSSNAIFNPNYLNDAIELLEATKALAPTDPKLFLTLGRLYKKAGNKEKAKENIKKAYELKPDYFDLKKELQGI